MKMQHFTAPLPTILCHPRLAYMFYLQRLNISCIMEGGLVRGGGVGVAHMFYCERVAFSTYVLIPP